MKQFLIFFISIITTININAQKAIWFLDGEKQEFIDKSNGKDSLKRTNEFHFISMPKKLTLEGVIDNKYNFTIKIKSGYNNQIKSKYSEPLMSQIRKNCLYNGFYYYKNPNEKLPLSLFVGNGILDSSTSYYSSTFFAYSFYKPKYRKFIYDCFKYGFENSPKLNWTNRKERNARIELDYFETLSNYDEKFDFSNNTWIKGSKKLNLKLKSINNQLIEDIKLENDLENFEDISNHIFNELLAKADFLVSKNDTFLIKDDLGLLVSDEIGPDILWYVGNKFLIIKEYRTANSGVGGQNFANGSVCNAASTYPSEVFISCLKFDTISKSFFKSNEIQIYDCYYDGRHSPGEDNSAKIEIKFDDDNIIANIETSLLRGDISKRQKRSYFISKSSGILKKKSSETFYFE